MGAAGEVDLLDGGVLDEQGGDLSGVLGAVREHVEAPCWEAGFLEDRPNGPVAAWGELGRFQDGGVAGCEGVGHSAEAEDVGRVPGRDELGGLRECIERGGIPGCYSQYHTVWLFVHNGVCAFLSTHRHAARNRDDPACNILEHLHARGDVEASGECRLRASLGHHIPSQLFYPALQYLSGLQQDIPPLCRFCFRPRREGCLRGLDGVHSIFFGGRGGLPDHFACRRVHDVEGCACLDLFAVDLEGDDLFGGAICSIMVGAIGSVRRHRE